MVLAEAAQAPTGRRGVAVVWKLGIEDGGCERMDGGVVAVAW